MKPKIYLNICNLRLEITDNKRSAAVVTRVQRPLLSTSYKIKVAQLVKRWSVARTL